jgi:hypothetical protein
MTLTSQGHSVVYEFRSEDAGAGMRTQAKRSSKNQGMFFEMDTPMLKSLWVGLAALLIGCAAGLKEINAPDRNTYVYGYAEVTGASQFQIHLKNEASHKRFSYSKNWMSVPFSTKEILFAFEIDPGKWQLESIVVSKGGQAVIPTGPRHTFEVVEGKGNYLGTIKGSVNPFEAIVGVDNFRRTEDKAAVDEQMGSKFPTFDSAATTSIIFAKE